MAKWVVAASLLVHGLIHLLGAAKAFGLADVLWHPIHYVTPEKL